MASVDLETMLKLEVWREWPRWASCLGVRVWLDKDNREIHEAIYCKVHMTSLIKMGFMDWEATLKV